MPLSISIATTKEQRRTCYRLRHEVFVVEQGVPSNMERDEHDETDAVHFLGVDGVEAVAAARIVAVGATAKIGRMVVVKKARGKKFGIDMMHAMVAYAQNSLVCKEVVLDAQIQAVAFYENLEFSRHGEEFMDAGIAHIRMVRPLQILV